MYESIGALGWIQIYFPRALYLLVFVAIPVFMLRMRDEVRLRLAQRALLAAVGVAVFLTISVALYAFLEPLGSDQLAFHACYLAPWSGSCCCCPCTASGLHGDSWALLLLPVVLLVVMTQNMYTLVVELLPLSVTRAGEPIEADGCPTCPGPSCVRNPVRARRLHCRDRAGIVISGSGAS